MSGQDMERQLFSQAANCALPTKKPGGWSAKGQPCDAIINHVKKVQDRLKDAALGLFNDLRLRPPTAQMEVIQMLFDPVIFYFNIYIFFGRLLLTLLLTYRLKVLRCGHVKRQLTGKKLLEVTIAAWFDETLLPDTLMVWAMVSRGCISKETICKIRGWTINDMEQRLKAGVLFLF